MALTSTQKKGSQQDIIKRLLRWCHAAPQGLALVEYTSEFDRQAVTQILKVTLASAHIPFHEVILPYRSSLAEVIDSLHERLEAIHQQTLQQLRQKSADEDLGVVSIVGLSTAFSREYLLEGLGLLNLNRERWASYPFRQIWWADQSFSRISQREMYDLYSWFILRLKLISEASEHALSTIEISSEEPTDLDDAHRRAQYLMERFEQALRDKAPLLENLQLFGLPAVEALSEAGSIRETTRLMTRLEPWLSKAKANLDGSMLRRLGNVYQIQSQWEESIEYYEQALSRCRALGDRHGEGRTLNNLGEVYRNQGRWDQAIECYEQSLAIKRTLGDRPGEGRTLNNLGEVYRNQGQWDQAIEYYEQSLAIKRLFGNRHSEGITLSNLGELYKVLGEEERAVSFWREALMKLHLDSREYRHVEKLLRDGTRPPIQAFGSLR